MRDNTDPFAVDESSISTAVPRDHRSPALARPPPAASFLKGEQLLTPRQGFTKHRIPLTESTAGQRATEHRAALSGTTLHGRASRCLKGRLAQLRLFRTNLAGLSVQSASR